MKKLFFICALLSSTLFYSCGEQKADEEKKTLVTSVEEEEIPKSDQVLLDSIEMRLDKSADSLEQNLKEMEEALDDLDE